MLKHMRKMSACKLIVLCFFKGWVESCLYFLPPLSRKGDAQSQSWCCQKCPTLEINFDQLLFKSMLQCHPKNGSPVYETLRWGLTCTVQGNLSNPVGEYVGETLLLMNLGGLSGANYIKYYLSFKGQTIWWKRWYSLNKCTSKLCKGLPSNIGNKWWPRKDIEL